MQELKNLLSEKSILESKLDHMEKELSYLQELLVKCGFSQGIDSLKIAVRELLKEEGKSLD